MSADRQKIDAAQLRALLTYDAETGIFRWRERRNHLTPKGSVAGTVNSKGYVMIGVARRLYQAHRLAWLYVTGEWPKDLIDHINTIRTDNRFENLREASKTENNRNRSAGIAGRKGLKGATFRKKEGAWYSGIWSAGKRIHLGTFSSEQEAHEAYCKAADEMHGEFANFGL
ncbi:MAG: HNH endonuclease [Paraburkholderia tropica]|uniref:HNH endonuclease n=1 Tax=Paraburkholderia tropica TaxID=92647 RepID=UPI003100D6F4